MEHSDEMRALRDVVLKQQQEIENLKTINATLVLREEKMVELCTKKVNNYKRLRDIYVEELDEAYSRNDQLDKEIKALKAKHEPQPNV